MNCVKNIQNYHFKGEMSKETENQVKLVTDA